MLTKATVILQVASEHREELVLFDTTYMEEYFDTFNARIDNVMTTIIGTDHGLTLRQSTAALRTIQKSALESLAIVHTQIKARFASDTARKNELLTILGFNQYYPKAKRGDQESLIQLLYRFNTYVPNDEALTVTEPGTIRAELVDKGIPNSRLTQLTNFATGMRDANTTQEDEKGDRKELTAETIAELNSIYDEIIVLCKIAQRVFKDNPTLKSRFSFYRVKPATNQGNDEEEEETPEEETPDTTENPDTTETEETDPPVNPS